MGSALAPQTKLTPRALFQLYIWQSGRGRGCLYRAVACDVGVVGDPARARRAPGGARRRAAASCNPPPKPRNPRDLVSHYSEAGAAGGGAAKPGLWGWTGAMHTHARARAAAAAAARRRVAACRDLPSKPITPERLFHTLPSGAAGGGAATPVLRGAMWAPCSRARARGAAGAARRCAAASGSLPPKLRNPLGLVPHHNQAGAAGEGVASAGLWAVTPPCGLLLRPYCTIFPCPQPRGF